LHLKSKNRSQLLPDDSLKQSSQPTSETTFPFVDSSYHSRRRIGSLKIKESHRPTRHALSCANHFQHYKRHIIILRSRACPRIPFADEPLDDLVGTFVRDFLKQRPLSRREILRR